MCMHQFFFYKSAVLIYLEKIILKSIIYSIFNLYLQNNVIRQPIGPGTSDKLVKDVEETLPDGRHTAKGRRAMFKTYSSAMSITDHGIYT